MNGQSGDLRWFALRTIPGREKMARDILRRWGLIAFIAIEKRLRYESAMAAKKKLERKERDFCSAPGYVLCGHPEAEPFPWLTAFRLHLIRSVVAVNGRPAELRHDAVMKFLRIPESNLPDHLKWFHTGAVHTFAPGDTVKIFGTSIVRDQKLVVEDVREGEAIFSLVWFGRTTEVKVPVGDCIPVEAAA